MQNFRQMTLPIMATGLLWLSLCGEAQQTPPTPTTNLFSQLFPKPTGKNGYEELALAAAILSQHPEENKLFSEYAPSLSALRKALNLPEIVRVRQLIRAGVNKRVASPRDPKSLDLNTTFPEYAQFRGLARMLRQEQYVSLADGRNAEAIETLGVMLQLGYVIQNDVLIGGLVGIAVQTIGIGNFEGALPFLSVRDCEALIKVAEAFAAAPSPLPRLLQQEGESLQRALPKLMQNPNEWVSSTGAEEDDPNIKDLERQLKENPSALEPLREQLRKSLQERYAFLVANAKLPPAQRKAAPPEPQGLAHALAASMMPNMTLVLKRYDSIQARLRMLGVRAALRRYWWEQGRFPDSLAALKQDTLIIDPFTDKPFQYARTEDDYRLSAQEN